MTAQNDGETRPRPRTRPRLTFESSEGITVLYGQENCTALELMESFISDRLWFGNPPFRLEVQDVPAERPFLNAHQVDQLDVMLHG